ncbi:MAG: hypothetical protein HKN47_02055 [Pirellulaceae bacterium]|nr:hypothetical protein [Pirellulaceae bacterium]
MKLIGVVSLVAFSALQCVAEIPKVPESKLAETCSHAFNGEVVQVYTKVKQTSANFEHTYGIAEIDVRDVKKGVEIEAGYRAYVRFWRKRWVGTGKPQPDHYGHWNIPSQGDRVTVYVKGDRRNGFDVMSPNGFFEVQSPDAREK